MEFEKYPPDLAHDCIAASSFKRCPVLFPPSSPPPLAPALRELVVPHIALCLLAFAGDNFRVRTGLYRATANDLPLLLLNQESFNSWMVS